MAEGIFIRLLGSVDARDGSRAVELGPPRRQAVLAMLAAHAGAPVTVEGLVDGVWGESAPRSAVQNVHTYIAGLRRALEPERSPRAPAGLLRGVRGGYLLALDPSCVDSLVFADRLERARALPADRALAHLDEALGLWRGPALFGLPGPFAETEGQRLEELRLTAVEERAALLLDAGRDADALDGLEQVAHAHPLRERLWELLIRAQAGSGRRAEAVRSFERARHNLAEELGVRPGQGLREALEGLEQVREGLGQVREGPGQVRDRRAPQQLPRDLRAFVGREAETAALCSLLAPPPGTSQASVVAVTGVAGAGKSALAVHVAHLLHTRFPDGRLFTNLRGATPGVQEVSPLEALGRFLRALGVAAEDVPVDLDEAIALWHSRLNGRRLLVVLDDAKDPAQVRPLLSVPEGNAVLLTSRESFSCVDDCAQVGLATLPEPEGAAMLAELVGGDRVRAEPRAGRRLVELCGGLPLAIRVAAARLLDDPHAGLARHVALLEDEHSRLEELQAGDIAVRSSLMGSWSALAGSEHERDRQAAAALAALGLLDVAEWSPRVVAALMGTDVAVAERALNRLAAAHLIDRLRSGRYHLHDLVRLFAREIAPPQRREPLRRALGFYAATARAATVLRDPHRVQPAGPPVTAAPQPFAGRDEACAWLVAEDPNLVAAAWQAMGEPDDEIAALGVAVTFALLWHQIDACAMADMRRLNERALAVSRRLGQDRLILECHNHLGHAANCHHRTPEAIWHYERQLDLARRLADPFCEQRALGNMASTQHTGGLFAQALDSALTQLALARREGFAVGERFALFIAGSAYRGLGRSAEARDLLTRAFDLAVEAGDDFQVLSTGRELAELYLDLYDFEEALERLTRTHALAVALNSKKCTIACLMALATAYRRLGDPSKAHAHLTEAAALIEETGDAYHLERLHQEERAVRLDLS
ncbi:BTAD domain-containing putative transcriptional regulator [Nonomuraea sp. NPDC059007]|uniref:AfsR/SARP family transcriptional regulator n=1 Tax=Nonomuraea sp. NPDC059007 TaxID=3346692 RepID=UPI0036C88718